MHQHLKNACRDDPRALNAIDKATQRGGGGQPDNANASKGKEEKTTLYNVQGRFRGEDGLNQHAKPAASRGVNLYNVQLDPQGGVGQRSKPEERGIVSNIHSSSPGVAQHAGTSKGNEEETNGNIVTIRFKYRGNQNTKSGESGIVYIVHNSTRDEAGTNQPAKKEEVNVYIVHIDLSSDGGGRNQLAHCTS